MTPYITIPDAKEYVEQLKTKREIIERMCSCVRDYLCCDLDQTIKAAERMAEQTGVPLPDSLRGGPTDPEATPMQRLIQAQIRVERVAKRSNLLKTRKPVCRLGWKGGPQ